MESKEISFSVRDIVMFIQDQLLSQEYGIFLDGDVIAAIIDLEQEFYLSQGITELQFVFEDDSE